MKRILVIIILSVSFFGCEKSFDELEKDPNRAITAPASLVLQGIEYDMYNQTGRPFSSAMRWNQFYAINYNYYGTNEYQWDEMPNHYFTLKNVVKMEEEARRAGAADVNGYSALGKFFRAFFYDQMSVRVGDLPAMEALEGRGNLTPKYDTQKQIYDQILKWLDEANADIASLIAKGDNLIAEGRGDFYFNGDLRKWQRTTNALKLRILMRLSKKEGDAELNVKNRFAEVLNNPAKYPLPEGMGDNLQFVSNNFNKYPSNPDNFGFDATRQNMAKTYIDLLTARQDPRVMVVAEPAGAQLKAGKKPSDFSAYVGASSGEDLTDMTEKAGRDNGAGFAPGTYSFQSRSRYYTNYEGEPTFILGYPEVCFNLAEGIHRGWASGNAETWYKKGIRASQEFYGVKDGTLTMRYSRTGGRDADDFGTYTIDFDFEKHYAQPLVKYDVGSAAGLEKILTQKYLAFFMNSGMEGYFNYRRTGIPQFYTGVGTGNSGRIAQRWQYPFSERTTNEINYKEAIQRQFGGDDGINQVLWISQ